MKESISKLYNRTSIKTKWIIFVLILIIYPMFLIGYVGYKNYEEAITNHFIESVQKDIKLVGELVREKLQDIEEFIAETQYDEVMYDFSTYYYNLIRKAGIDLERASVDEQVHSALKQAVMQDYNLKGEIEKYLKSIILSRQDILLGAFQFAEQEDMGYIVSKEKGNAYYEQQSFDDNKIFQYMDQELSKESNTAYYIDKENNIYIGQKIFYRDNFRHSGTIIFKVDQEYVFKRYQSMLGESKEAVYVLANESKELIAVGNLQDERKNKLKRFVHTNQIEDSFYTEDKKGEAIVYNTFRTKNLSIASGVFISLGVLLADIRELSTLIFMLCMSMIPIFLVLANRLYREVIYPVYNLSDKMHQIEQGKLGVEIENDRSDEIGYVYSAFNKMSKEMQYLVNCVYKEQIALKNAEIKALQAQINPHFLYNTLEMINWKARMSGNEDISEMIEALSGIMEINIDRRESHFLTIEEEIKYLRNYIFLIQKRFGDKIKFEESVEEVTLEYRIPRLLLQPIVENAIGHGIEPVGKGTIFLEIRRDEENLTISISDDGKGIEEKRLEKIKSELTKVEKKYIEDEEMGKGHIGIINVQRRIQLLYGEDYGIHIESKENKGTKIMLVLPTTVTGVLIREEGKGEQVDV